MQLHKCNNGKRIFRPTYLVCRRLRSSSSAAISINFPVVPRRSEELCGGSRVMVTLPEGEFYMSLHLGLRRNPDGEGGNSSGEPGGCGGTGPRIPDCPGSGENWKLGDSGGY